MVETRRLGLGDGRVIRRPGVKTEGNKTVINNALTVNFYLWSCLHGITEEGEELEGGRSAPAPLSLPVPVSTYLGHM